MGLPRPLDAVEIRVLGCLLEKQQTTPEYYPLSINALVAACNQRSNRDPVLRLSEPEVRSALDRLREHVLIWSVDGSRVERFEHNLDRRWELAPASKAVITELLLRGSQTPGELRSRSQRAHRWSSLAEVGSVLRDLATRPEPLVVELPRQDGQKETRWMHLAGGEVDVATLPEASGRGAGDLAERVEALERRVTELVELVADLSEQLRR